MAYWLIDPTNNIELEFDSISSIKLTSLAELKKYTSQEDNSSQVSYANPQPLTIAVDGIFITSSEFSDIMRKLLYFDKCGEEILLIDGHNEHAYLGYLEAPTMSKAEPAQLIMPVSFSLAMKGQIFGIMAEAEDVNGVGTPANGTITADANASEGYCIVCDASTEGGSIQATQSEWKLPITDYRIYVRAKDSAQVANDLTLRIYNTSDSTDAGSTTKTLTASYVWYSLDVTLAADDIGNALEVQAYKTSATANSISIDMIVVVAI